MLSAFRRNEAVERGIVPALGLNAPSGAQCFPTWSATDHRILLAIVSMHLLALNAFRPDAESDSTIGRESQCTFWRSVPSDRARDDRTRRQRQVLMHLLVLSTFRQAEETFERLRYPSQCTSWCPLLSDRKTSTSSVISWSLNAPSGAQCFPTRVSRPLAERFRSQCTFWRSVLSDRKLAGRRQPISSFSLNAPSGAQCFPTRKEGKPDEHHRNSSQCTFWRSVPSDPSRRGWEKSASSVSMHLLALSAFRRLTEFVKTTAVLSQCTF